jgi:hypothetical protein
MRCVMTELTIPFWLASSVLVEGQTVNGWLHSQRVQARWIDEVIQIRDSGAEQSVVTGISADVLQVEWVDTHISDQYFVHSACREIEVGDRRLILLLSCHKNTSTVVLLAAPAAVGMYNLLPLVYMEELFEFNCPVNNPDVLAFLDIAIQKKQKKTSSLKALGFIQSSGKRPVKAETAFANAAWVKLPEEISGSLAACHEMVQVLTQKQQSNGLTVEVSANQVLFATWMERV